MSGFGAMPVCWICWHQNRPMRAPAIIEHVWGEPPEVCGVCGHPTTSGIFVRNRRDESAATGWKIDGVDWKRPQPDDPRYPIGEDEP